MLGFIVMQMSGINSEKGYWGKSKEKEDVTIRQLIFKVVWYPKLNQKVCLNLVK